MKTILNVTLSANGSPSEVKDRISTQVQANGDLPEQAAVMAAARSLIDKAIVDVSEDATIAVRATVTVSVADAPPIVTAKTDALLKEVADTKAALDSARADSVAVASKLAQATTELEQLRTPPTTEAVDTGSLTSGGTAPSTITPLTLT